MTLERPTLIGGTIDVSHEYRKAVPYILRLESIITRVAKYMPMVAPPELTEEIGQILNLTTGSGCSLCAEGYEADVAYPLSEPGVLYHWPRGVGPPARCTRKENT